MSVINNISDKMPNVSDKNRNIIVGAIMLVIFLLFYFAGIGPQLNTLNKISPKIDILKKDINQANDDMARMGQYRDGIKKYEGQLGSVTQKVKTKREVPVILEEISYIAKDYDVRIDQMMPLVDSQELLLSNQDGDYYALPILIEASSGYHNFGRFLNRMEVEGTALTIDQFTFAATASDRHFHSARLTLKVVLFEKKSES